MKLQNKLLILIVLIVSIFLVSNFLDFTLTGNAILDSKITKSSQKISDTEGNFLETLDNSDQFGVSVTSIGDLDGDNITDIAVGAFQDDDGGACCNTNRGAVYILFMNTNGTVKSSQKISDTQGNFNEVLNDGNEFGRSVAPIGDLDGDNITDIVVGSAFDDDGGDGRGAIYVLFMNANGTVKSSQKISNTAGNFNEELNDSDLFGSSVASIGDLDNDSIVDIVVGAFQDDDGGSNHGAVYILFMNTNGTVKSSQKISNTTGNFNEALDNGDTFGISVTSIGDLDGDNIMDIVVGAKADDDGGGSAKGAVYVLFLNEMNTPTITLNSPANDSKLSTSVTFSKKVVDPSGILNVSLILDGIYNESNSSGINNTNYIFTKTFSGGTHNWTYEVCDTIDNCVNSTVLTFTIDSTNPTATAICNPSDIYTGGDFPCTCSGSDSGSGVSTTSESSTGSIIDTTTAGAYTYTCTVTDIAGNSATSTATYTVLNFGGGSLDSTSKEGAPTAEKTHLFTSINPEEETKVEFDSGIGVEIKIEVNQESSNVKIQVSKYDSKPASVSVESSGKTYRYLEINTENLNENLNKAIVKFEVEKNWVSDNGLDKEDVVIYKFDEQVERWNELETTFDSEDDNFYYYAIELDSFSFFAIGEKVKIPIISDIVESYEEAKQTPYGSIIWWSIFGILLLGIIIVGYLIKMKRKNKRNTLNLDNTYK